MFVFKLYPSPIVTRNFWEGVDLDYRKRFVGQAIFGHHFERLLVFVLEICFLRVNRNRKQGCFSPLNVVETSLRIFRCKFTPAERMFWSSRYKLVESDATVCISIKRFGLIVVKLKPYFQVISCCKQRLTFVPLVTAVRKEVQIRSLISLYVNLSIACLTLGSEFIEDTLKLKTQKIRPGEGPIDMWPDNLGKRISRWTELFAFRSCATEKKEVRLKLANWGFCGVEWASTESTPKDIASRIKPSFLSESTRNNTLPHCSSRHHLSPFSESTWSGKQRAHSEHTMLRSLASCSVRCTCASPCPLVSSVSIGQFFRFCKLSVPVFVRGKAWRVRRDMTYCASLKAGEVMVQTNKKYKGLFKISFVSKGKFQNLNR